MGRACDDHRIGGKCAQRLGYRAIALRIGDAAARDDGNLTAKLIKQPRMTLTDGAVADDEDAGHRKFPSNSSLTQSHARRSKAVYAGIRVRRAKITMLCVFFSGTL